MGILSGLWAGAKMVLGFGGGESKGSDNVMKIASGIGGFIDEQNFTPEERAVYNAKMVDSYGGFMQSTVAENTQRSITRREVAILVIRVELAVLVFGAGFLGMYRKDWADIWWKIGVDSPLGLLTLGVGAFFFGTHMLRSFADKK